MKQNETQKVTKSNLNRDWFLVCLGLILIAFTIVAATGKTFAGQFLAYCFAYLFGIFYPFILVLILILAIRLIVSKRLFSLKGRGILFTGIILLSVSVLAFGSYSIYTSREGGVPFMDLVNVYNDRFESFSRTPFEIDSYEALGSLGGGFLGLFFVTLLGSLWGSVGDAIFFSLLLVAALIMILYRPVKTLIDTLKVKKQKKVNYTSPYQPKKNGKNPHLAREYSRDNMVLENPSPDLTAPLDDSWTTAKKKTAEPQETEETVEESHPSRRKQSAFVSTDGTYYSDSDSSAFAPAKKNASPLSDDVYQKSAFVSSTPYPKEEETEPAETKPVEEEAVEEPKPKPVTTEKRSAFTPVSSFVPPTAEEIAAEEEKEETPLPQPQPEKEPAFTSAFSSTPTPAPKEETKPVENKPYVNPLERVAKHATPAPSSGSQEYSVNMPVEEEEPEAAPAPTPAAPVSAPAPAPKPELTEEEKEEQAAAKYFAKKQQEKAEQMLAKKKEKDEKLASLMKYVSDKPRDYDYPFPDDTLLAEVDDSAKMAKNTESAQEKASIINKVFDEFDVKAKATSFTIGASVTRFNVETEHGEKADKIANLTSEFQRALNGDMSVRVETVVEGRSTSGIEVGNAAPMAVSFKDAFMSIEANTKDPLLLPIGKDISGNIISFPLNKMPHLLVAGTTGSGKSVLIHSMIMTLIMRNYPSQMKLMLIDPKQVEFIRYQDCSHLFCPVISKPESAILALKKLCTEMDRRFGVLSKYRCSNLEDYNALRKGRENSMEAMPYIVTIIDEFADLMQTGGNEVTRYVTRIAQKARACGIHLIIATQRPSKDNVPMIIKANVPSRIGLSVSSQVDSRVILDENGAETLLGRGDLLFKCPGKKSLIRCQSPYVSNEDINNVLAYIKKYAGDPNYDPEFLDLDEASSQEEVEEVDPEAELYESVRDFVVSTGISSKSTLMRSFQLSSAKADQYISRLVQEGTLMLGANGKYVVTHLEDYQA